MCIIVDVNVAHKIFLTNNDADFSYLHSCIINGKPQFAKIVYGGYLTTEYLRQDELKRMLFRLDQAGRARNVNDEQVNRETENLKNRRICRSDDEHIIALARVGGVRLLCTDDQRLCVDFRNYKLLNSPRGSIYRNSSHKHLLGKHRCTHCRR